MLLIKVTLCYKHHIFLSLFFFLIKVAFLEVLSELSLSREGKQSNWSVRVCFCSLKGSDRVVCLSVSSSGVDCCSGSGPDAHLSV